MKEDIDTLKDDWLTDNVCGEPIITSLTPLILLSGHLVLARVRACTCYSKYCSTAQPTHRYLEREYLKEYKNANIVLLRPSMSFMLMQTRDPLTLKEALPDFTRTTHIFLPINDCRNPSVAEGGSHWSLLLVSVVDGVAFHYDSLQPSNRQEANHAAHQLSQLLGRRLQFIDLLDAPQQQNSSDCGVFVCILMRYLLLKKLLMAHAKEKISMSLGDKTVDAASGRKDMLKIIETFRKEGERRRS